MSQITVNPVAEVGEPNAGKFKVHTPTADTYHVTQWAAIQAAVDAVSVGGGDTVQLLAGAFTLDVAIADYNIKAPGLWEITRDVSQVDLWDENPSPATGGGAPSTWQFLRHMPILVEKPCTIKGVKAGDTFSSIVQGAEFWDTTGFVVHNGAKVTFKDLKFSKMSQPVVQYAPGDVLDCYFDNCTICVRQLIDDRLVFPNLEFGDYKTVNASNITGNYFNKCMTCFQGGSGARVLNNHRVGRVDGSPYYFVDIQIFVYLGLAAAYPFGRFPGVVMGSGETMDGRLYNLVSGSLPVHEKLVNIEVFDNIQDWSGTDGDTYPFAVFPGFGGSYAADVQYGRNTVKNAFVSYQTFIFNEPYGPRRVGVFPGYWGSIKPCLMEDIHLFDNKWERDEETPSSFYMGFVNTSSRGTTRNITFSNNEAVNVYEPVMKARGLAARTSSSFGQPYGVCTKVDYYHNNLHDSGMPSGWLGYVWGFAPISSPTGGVAAQPPGKWSFPADPLTSFIFDRSGGLNTILGGKGIGGTPGGYGEPPEGDNPSRADLTEFHCEKGYKAQS